MAVLVQLVLLSLVAMQVEMHSYHLGDCPDLAAMDGFNMTRFLGKWYVIQRTQTSKKGLTIEFTRGEMHDEFEINEVSDRPAYQQLLTSSKRTTKGDLKVLNPNNPAKMSVKFEYNPLGSYDYTIFMTDYDHYAGVFSCQKALGANRRSASILSRTPSLDIAYADKVRTRLQQAGIDLDSLSFVEHSGVDSSESKVPDLDMRQGNYSHLPDFL